MNQLHENNLFQLIAHESLAITVYPFYSLVWLLKVQCSSSISWCTELTKGSSFILAFSYSRIVQFSRCSLRRFAFEKLSFLSRGDLFIIPHFRKFVKSFFEVFLRNFFVFLLMRFLESLALCNLSIRSQAFLLYHILRHLSRGFSNFFEIFSCLTQWLFLVLH